MDLIARHGQLEIIYDKEKLKYKLKHAENNQLSNNRMTNVERNLGQIYQGAKKWKQCVMHGFSITMQFQRESG